METSGGKVLILSRVCALCGLSEEILSVRISVRTGGISLCISKLLKPITVRTLPGISNIDVVIPIKNHGFGVRILITSFMRLTLTSTLRFSTIPS